MPSAYKLLEEHSNKSGYVDSDAAGAPHLVFAQTQKKLKCHKCGLPNYTVYNCPNCKKNKNEDYNKQGKGNKKQVRFHKSTFKKQESFAQLKAKGKNKAKNNKTSHNANMGFAQPAEITNLTIEEINQCIGDNDPRNNIVQITGVQDDDVTIDDIDICAPDKIDDMKDQHIDEAMALIVESHNQLMNEASSELNEEAWLNKCLLCGGWPGSVHASNPNCKICQWGYDVEDLEEEVSIVENQE